MSTQDPKPRPVQCCDIPPDVLVLGPRAVNIFCPRCTLSVYARPELALQAWAGAVNGVRHAVREGA